MANIAIVIYSMYHHIATLAEEVKKGIETTGSTATIYQVPETLDEEVLGKMYAPAKPDYPLATTDILQSADGILFGVPTRYGNMPAQMKAFIDATGGLWQQGKLYHKPAGVFVSTGTGAGRETTVATFLSTLAHHGMLYIPLGYAAVFGELTNLEEVHGASPWGAGTVAGADGSRTATANELKVAQTQGTEFANAVIKLSGNGNGKAKEAKEAKESKEASATKAATAPATKSAAKPVAKPAATKTAAKPSSAAAAAAPAKKEKEKKKNPLSRFFSKLFD